jgi:hypothetical protein
MACGRMRLPRETFGVLRGFSGYPLRLFAFVLGALFGGLGGFVGATVDFGVNEAEEFGEVGCGPAFDGRCQSLWNHDSQFTS